MKRQITQRVFAAIEAARFKRVSETGRARLDDVLTDLIANPELAAMTKDEVYITFLRRLTQMAYRRPGIGTFTSPAQLSLDLSPTFVIGGECYQMESVTVEPLKAFTEKYRIDLETDQARAKQKQMERPLAPDFSARQAVLKTLETWTEIHTRFAKRNPDITLPEALKREERRVRQHTAR